MVKAGDFCKAVKQGRTLVEGIHDVAFLSDLTGTMDYPDLGFGAMSALQMHHAMLTNIALTTADVMTSDDFLSRMK